MLIFLLTVVTGCSLPQIIYYGDRMKNLEYHCLYHLGSKPGVTPPCAQMCPYNITFNFHPKIMHFTSATPYHPDYSYYQINLVTNNCTSGTLQVVWYGPSLTLYLGSLLSNKDRECPFTKDPFPCPC